MKICKKKTETVVADATMEDFWETYLVVADVAVEIARSYSSSLYSYYYSQTADVVVAEDAN
ncbi:MAG: hypothetical protein ACLUD1_05290 [Clostridia bacterium]